MPKKKKKKKKKRTGRGTTATGNRRRAQWRLQRRFLRLYNRAFPPLFNCFFPLRLTLIMSLLLI